MSQPRTLKFTIEMDVWALDEHMAARAADQLQKMTDFLRRLPLEVFQELPTGGITGEQATGLDPGWMAFFKVAVSDGN